VTRLLEQMKDTDGWITDLSQADMEVPVPKLPAGIISAESFGCIEMLGVLPPPEKGWQRQGKAADGKAAWLANKVAPDWIYNMNEQKYYHAPSKSWWEKRPLESQDPKAPPYTFVRTDAFHLKALRHFAASLDSGALPLAWQSWTLYVKKKKAAVQIAAAPVVEEVQHVEDAGADLPAEREEIEPKLPQLPQLPADNSAIIAAIANAPEDEEGEEEEEAEEDEEVAEEESERPTAKAPVKSRKKGWCFCFRSRAPVDSDSGSEQEETSPLLKPVAAPSIEPAAKPPPPSERTASTATGSASQDAAVTDTSRSLGVESPKKEEAPRILPPADELQTRRLQFFLTDISRNPQRLVTHVERRRADKTAASFM